MCRAAWRNDLTPMVLCHEPEYVFEISNDVLAAFVGLAGAWRIRPAKTRERREAARMQRHGALTEAREP